MSKFSSFVFSCIIHILFLFLFFLISKNFVYNKQSVEYGNSDITILFIDKMEDEVKDIKQDFLKDVSKQKNETLKEMDEKTTIENEFKKIEDDNFNYNDLFSNLNVEKKEKKIDINKQNQSNQKQLEALNKLKKSLTNTTIKSNGSYNEASETAKVAGVYDAYFGNVNAYLKNIWSLVTADANGIDEKEKFEVSFKIFKNGIIKINDDYFVLNTILRKKARIFIDTINNQNKNLGIPPEQKDYTGVLRLSVVLSIKEIK